MDPIDQNKTPLNKPTAPPVPKELLSARPAMTRVVPRSPDKVAAASKAMGEIKSPTPPPPLTPEQETERQERIDYLKNVRGAKESPRSGSRKWIIVTIVLLVLVAGGLGAAYWKLNAPTKTAPAATTVNEEERTANDTQNQTDKAALKDYESSNFALSLRYPTDWTLNDTANALTITSTSQKLPGADGQQKSGAVVVTIRHKMTSLPEFKNGNAVAVLDSKNVPYATPATGQRATTFLSYLQYADTTTKGALDAIYITGNSGYKRLQGITQEEVTKVDPLVTVSFVECSTTCTPTSTAINVNGETWAASQLNTTVETLLKSLAFN